MPIKLWVRYELEYFDEDVGWKAGHGGVAVLLFDSFTAYTAEHRLDSSSLPKTQNTG
jgi:hypothetical protein